MTQQTDQQSDPAATAEQPGGPGAPGAADPHLAEWDRSRAAPAASTVPKELEPVIRFAEAKMVEEVKTTIEKEVATAIDTLTSGNEEFKSIPKRVTRGYLEAWALDNPEFKAAYEKRKSNPKGWDGAMKAAAEGFAEDMKGFGGSSVRSDVEAAKASVRGTSTAPPPPQRTKSTPELNKMSDWEFAEYKRELAARA